MLKQLMELGPAARRRVRVIAALLMLAWQLLLVPVPLATRRPVDYRCRGFRGLLPWALDSRKGAGVINRHRSPRASCCSPSESKRARAQLPSSRALLEKMSE